jgi:hypothetical protein
MRGLISRNEKGLPEREIVQRVEGELGELERVE